MQSDPTPDRDAIETVINRVKAGELSPSEATEMLLGGKRPRAGTIAELVDRLGSPPQDIVDQWSDQVCQILITRQTESAEPFPAADLNDWLIDATGKLLLRGRFRVTEAETHGSGESIQAAHDYVVRFRSLLSTGTGLSEDASVSRSVESSATADAASVPRTEDAGRVPNPEVGASRTSSNQAFPDSVDASGEVRAERISLSGVTEDIRDAAADRADTESAVSTADGSSKGLRHLPTVIVGVLLVASILAIAIILYRASRPNDVADAKQSGPRPAETAGDRNPGLDLNTSDPVNPSSRDAGVTAEFERPADSTSSLATFDSMDPSADTAADADDAPALMSLDEIIPEMPMLSMDIGPSKDDPKTDHGDAAPGADPTGTDAALSESAGNDVGSAMSPGPPDDPLQEGGDDNAPTESPQPTRTAELTSIQLPPTDDTDTKRSILDASLTTPTLEFPFDVKLRLRPQSVESEVNSSPAAMWSVTDEQNGTVIARVSSDEDQCWFRWTSDAKNSNVSKSLLHGRIRDGQDRMIYLRPSIEADPWSIPFDRSDSRPTWDLTASIPSRVSRISINLDLPEQKDKDAEIELGWIEPVKTASPRRTRGLAVLTPKDGETVAVGLRFDIRCSRKLSCRVRTFGRLDPEAPWHLISRPMLDQVANQLTSQATRLSQMSTQIESMYSKSDTEQRRMLRPRREAIEQQYDRVVTVSNRVADLWALVSRIESDVMVQIRIWIQWPESQQDLLAMPLADD